MSQLINTALVDIKENGQEVAPRHLFSLSDFIAEASAAAGLSAQAKSVRFTTQPVEATLALCGNRDSLLSAVTNLLQNAVKFTKPNREVILSAYASADRILIDVKDHCGGLPVGAGNSMFLPFAQAGRDRSGMGLGLTIAKNAVEASDGVISVRDIPGSGCIFTVNVPRYSIEI